MGACEAQRDVHSTMRNAHERMEKTISLLCHVIDKVEGALQPVLSPEEAVGKTLVEKEYLTRTEREATMSQFTRDVSNCAHRLERLLERLHP